MYACVGANHNLIGLLRENHGEHMANLLKLSTVGYLNLLQIIGHFDHFKPPIVFPDEQGLGIQQTYGAHGRFALEVLDKLEFPLDIVDTQPAIPAANENVRLRRTNCLGLLGLDH